VLLSYYDSTLSYPMFAVYNVFTGAKELGMINLRDGAVAGGTLDPNTALMMDADSVLIPVNDSPNRSYLVYNVLTGAIELQTTVFEVGTSDFFSTVKMDEDTIVFVFRDQDDTNDGKFVVHDVSGTLAIESGEELYINAGDTFKPKGNVTVDTGGLDLNGIWQATANETVTVSHTTVE